MSSPEMQLQSPPLSPQGNVHPSYLYSMNERRSTAGRGGGRGNNIQRRRSENYRERPLTVGVPERRGSHKQHSMAPQPKSDSYLQYNLQERGSIHQRAEGSPVRLQTRHGTPQQLSPSGAEMRTFQYEEREYSRDGYNSPRGSKSPYGYAPAEEQYHQNVEEQRY